MTGFTKPETSPFTPGQPVPADLFVGRQEQIEALLRKARDAASGRLSVAFLTGERGIGKTSLAQFASWIAREEHGLLPLHVVVGTSGSPEEVVRRTLDRLARVARTEPWWQKVSRLFGGRVEKVGLFGFQVQFQPQADELASLTEHFDFALRNVVQELPEDIRGLHVVLDDINGLADSPAFAFWLKTFVDTVAVEGLPLPVCLVMAGTERVRRKLVGHHESVARILDLVDLAPWSENEVRDFYHRAFGSAGMELTGPALDAATRFAGGLPVLAHEIGDAIFRVATGPVVSVEEAREGIVNAAHVVGNKHVAVRVFERIRSGRYRSLLRRIPQLAPGGRFRRKEIQDHLDPPARKVLDNFLREMVKLEVLERLPETGPGEYRFVQNLHYIYFLSEAVRYPGPGSRKGGS